MGTNSMNLAIEIRKSDDGAILARRLDGKPLTPGDREQARRIALVDQTPVSDPTVIIDGNILAVLIDSTLLRVPIWFALRDGWRPDEGDDTPIFYASELPALQAKTPEELRSIFKIKSSFGGGLVRQ